ncbi:MAG: SpoIIE family protein phosphatase [Candidatus Firestonebacteria bacterium]|nr:SpoIIE family protein phosphatase [Candidatus Firestonebacteria bacterium]
MKTQNKVDKLEKQLSSLRKKNHRIKMELDVLNKVGKALGSVFNLDDLLNMIMGMITEIMEADRSTLYILDKEKNVLWSKIAQCTQEIKLQVGQGIAGYVCKTGENINIPDAYKDTRFNPETDKKTGYRTRSMLTIPMRDHNGEITGVIQVLNKKKAVFNKNDEELASVLGTHISMAIENVKLYEYYLAKKEIEHEMKIAYQTQKSLLPNKSPEIANYDISGFNTPAKDTGGDYYDFIELDKGKLALAIGDITGKGLPAALLMTTARAYIRALSSLNTSIKETIEKVNKAMCADTESDKFLTLFYGVLNTQDNTFSFTNAGHDAPFWFHGEAVDTLITNNLFLGSFPGIPYNEKKIQINKGDIIALYTDGVVEARNEKNELFGEDRFIQLIKENNHLSSQQLIEKTYQEVKKFIGKCSQQDDITLIIVKAI